MSTSKADIKKRDDRERCKRQYWQNLDYHKERQYRYRYVRGSTQKIVDDNWHILSKLKDEDKRLWALENGFADALSPSRFIAFWKAVQVNKEVGNKAVKERIKEMAEFASNMKSKTE